MNALALLKSKKSLIEENESLKESLAVFSDPIHREGLDNYIANGSSDGEPNRKLE